MTKTTQQLEGASAGPRITPAAIEANIASEHYFTAADGERGAANSAFGYADHTPLGRLTFCVLVLHNGSTITGESTCALPATFNAGIEKRIARQNAVEIATQLKKTQASAINTARPRKMLRLWDVRDLTGLSESHVYGLMAKGEFPTRVVISRRCTCWFEDEIMAWMDARAKKRTAA